MYIDNCLKMIREELLDTNVPTPRGWTIRFNDYGNIVEGFPVSTTVDIDELYHDWYGDCLSGPENGEIIFDVIIAHNGSGRCYLIETHSLDFETLMWKIKYWLYD